jgi:predicted naringenin-chalcone synthase
MADSICKTTPGAQVMIVCTELCTLHFQHEGTTDNITSSLLFADGAGAALVCHDDHARTGLHLKHFYSEVITRGKRDMAWELSSSGFVMTLSGYVPELIEEDFAPLVKNAFQNSGCSQEDTTHWCIHPGGKRILDAVCKTLKFTNGELQVCYDILREYGNMSSATIFFVLNRILQELKSGNSEKDNVVFGAAFGPGLTMETFVASTAN